MTVERMERTPVTALRRASRDTAAPGPEGRRGVPSGEVGAGRSLGAAGDERGGRAIGHERMSGLVARQRHQRCCRRQGQADAAGRTGAAAVTVHRGLGWRGPGIGLCIDRVDQVGLPMVMPMVMPVGVSWRSSVMRPVGIAMGWMRTSGVAGMRRHPGRMAPAGGIGAMQRARRRQALQGQRQRHQAQQEGSPEDAHGPHSKGFAPAAQRRASLPCKAAGRRPSQGAECRRSFRDNPPR